MNMRRGWTIAVIAAAVVLTAVAAIEGLPTWRFVGIVSVHVVLVAFWFAIGRRALTEQRFAIPTVIGIIALASVDTYFDSAMATIQCIGFPLIWVLIEGNRRTVPANIVLAVLVGVGQVIGNGATATAFVVAVIIQTISLAFSLALGLWITNIATQSDERQRLLDELEAVQGRVAALSRDAGAAAERERLALEIHDTIAQDLAGLVLTAQRGRRELAAGHNTEAENQLAILEDNARHALAETRALVAVGAAVVPDAGLPTALKRLAERFERETGITVTVTGDESTRLARDGEVVLLRCAQEALANVRKHSSATAATVALAVHGDDIELTITDDGGGFDPESRPPGFGLDGMRERLGLVQGSLAVRSAPGRGTTLVATLPTSAATATPTTAQGLA